MYKVRWLSNGENTLIQSNKQAVKVALVTGGARRIGAAIVKSLHQAGFKVLIHCHHSLNEAEALLQILQQNRPDSATLMAKNLEDPQAATELIEETIAWGGRLDLLVNNASTFTPTDLANFEENSWDALFQVNTKAPFLLSLAAYPYLKKQRGVIINLTDIHASQPLKGYAVYCQSKAALMMQTKALAREFAPEVRVNAVAPGAIIWPEHENALSIVAQQKIIAKTPLKQHGDPNYIAQAVLALADNPFITGQILNVDGGRSIYS